MASALSLIASPAQATSITFTANMTGSQEVPPNGSPATGFTWLIIDDVLHTITIDVTYAGLTGGNPSAAHVHCCQTAPNTNVGVAVGYSGFPTTPSGHYYAVLSTASTSIYTSAFLNSPAAGGTALGAEAALIAGLAAGNGYSNIHNSVFPGGEIRGQLAVATPEPATWTLLGLGLAGVFARRLRSRR